MKKSYLTAAICVAATLGSAGLAYGSKCVPSGPTDFQLVATEVTVDGEAQPIEAYRDRVVVMTQEQEDEEIVRVDFFESAEDYSWATFEAGDAP